MSKYNHNSLTNRFATLFGAFICSFALLSSTTARAEDPAASPARKPTFFIVGDSTVKNGTRGQVGWGDPIGAYFDRDRITVENDAIGGRSSRTFQTEGRWDKILAKANPGDFVIIQMGHNDGGAPDEPTRARGSLRGIGEETQEIDNPITHKKEIVHTYGWYLRKYVADARAKGMTSILCSPVPHCPKATVEAGAVEASNYVVWSSQVAAAEHVPFIDLNRIIMSHYVGMSPEQIRAKYFTTADTTHSSAEGAALNAGCVVEGLKTLKDVPLAHYLREPAATPPPATPLSTR